MFRGQIHNTAFSLKKRTEMAAASDVQEKDGEERVLKQQMILACSGGA
jgi:hypothetical protein